MKKLLSIFFSILFVITISSVSISNSYSSTETALGNQTEIININEDESPYRVGAECCDGTSSDATGRGACSHHGGVKFWKYSDGSTKKTGKCK